MINWFLISDTPYGVNMKEETASPGLSIDAYLSCDFRGFPDIVFWSKDGSPVNNYTKFYVHPLQLDFVTGLTSSILQVRNVVKMDYGSYKCVGHNKFGNNSNGLTGQLIGKLFHKKITGPSCSKLTMMLVNI